MNDTSNQEAINNDDEENLYKQKIYLDHSQIDDKKLASTVIS